MKIVEPTVAFVYLGPRLPRYVRKNLEYFRKTFPSQQFCIVVDDINLKKELNLRNINSFLISEKEKALLERRKNFLTHDLHFRNGFWLNTLNRLFALQILVERNNLRKVIHIESDVLCLPNFPFDKFNELDIPLAYPLESPDLGIASTLFIRDSEAINHLCEYGINVLMENPKLTDMKLLGRYAELFRNRVKLLPTFSSFNQLNPRFMDFERCEEIIESEKYFQGVFDSVSIGQFLLGIDPRNNRGVLKQYSEDSNHLLKVTQLRLVPKEDNITIQNIDGSVDHLYTLHIHSKNLRAFNFPFNIDLIMKNYERSVGGESRKILLRYFVAQLLTYMKRRVHEFS